MHSYLAASLPLCTLGQTPPMSLDAFYLQCSGILAADELQDLENMVHHHLSECRTAFGRTWSAINTQMDNEMAALRAQKWQIQTPWTHLHPGFSL
jgi:ElaB/YqjD/DUF883 family membrane-anchored ribosome-binding protein